MWEFLRSSAVLDLVVRPEVLPILGIVMSLLVLGVLSMKGTRRDWGTAELPPDDEAARAARNRPDTGPV